jgi:hypothetical protein
LIKKNKKSKKKEKKKNGSCRRYCVAAEPCFAGNKNKKIDSSPGGLVLTDKSARTSLFFTGLTLVSPAAKSKLTILASPSFFLGQK